MQQFSFSDEIISELINRLMNCRVLHELGIYGSAGNELSGLYPAIERKNVKLENKWDAECIYVRLSDSVDQLALVKIIRKYISQKDIILYEPSEIDKIQQLEDVIGKGYDLSFFSSLPGRLYLSGKTFTVCRQYEVPSTFRVLAVIHFYNEEDILGKTIEYLIGQGVSIYLIDNWSSDQSFLIASEYQKKYPDRITLERFPADGGSDDYIWYDQLQRTEQISKDTDYDWYIHYDADEIRISPWEGITLLESIYNIDRQGYNGIENTVIDFRLTETSEQNIFAEDGYFGFRHIPHWIDQLKTWKKSPEIDLKKSGGHHARFPSPRLFPLKFLNRHYPMRSIKQAEKKVFTDRKPRFKKENSTRGWHGHYNWIRNSRDLIFERNELIKWGENTFHDLYIPLFTECGLWWEAPENDFSKVTGPSIKQERLVVYGAGNIGKKAYLHFCADNNIVAWVDQNGELMPSMYCQEIGSVEKVAGLEFDHIILAVKNKTIQREMLERLEKIGVKKDKVLGIEVL